MENKSIKVKKMCVMTVVGTRPEIIRLSRTIDKLDKFTNHILVHTGQNYDFELNEIFFNQLKIRKPDVFLGAAGDTAIETIGNIFIEIDKVLQKYQPDAFLVLGDTNSALTCLAAKRKKIPIFHMEAGNRCFDQRVPEEINRKIVDHTSDINLTYSSIAREYLLKEGFPPDQVIKIGSPMREVINYHIDEIKKSKVMSELMLETDKYFLVSCHREENVDDKESLTNLVNTLNELAISYKKIIIFSLHPRTKRRLDTLAMKLDSRIKLHKPFGFIDYCWLQMNAKAVLSDSGTITEEASILNFPALNLREAQERPEGFEEGSVMLVGFNWERISMALKVLETESRGDRRTIKMVDDYRPDNVSEKVIRIIASYVDYINQKVWKKRSAVV